jgi:hypothetical protein
MRENRGVQDSIATPVNQQFSAGDLQQYDLHNLSATAARNAFPFHILKDTLTLVTPIYAIYVKENMYSSIEYSLQFHTYL